MRVVEQFDVKGVRIHVLERAPGEEPKVGDYVTATWGARWRIQAVERWHAGLIPTWVSSLSVILEPNDHSLPPGTVLMLTVPQ